jgi:hypothetical protein
MSKDLLFHHRFSLYFSSLNPEWFHRNFLQVLHLSLACTSGFRIHLTFLSEMDLSRMKERKRMVNGRIPPGIHNLSHFQGYGVAQFGRYSSSNPDHSISPNTSTSSHRYTVSTTAKLSTPFLLDSQAS